MELDEYWKNLQQAIHDNRLIYEPLNGKTPKFLSKHNLTSEDVKRLIKKLKIDDCIDGPENEREPHAPIGLVTEYKRKFVDETDISDINVYIKLKVFKACGGYGCYVWSFHE